MPDTTQQTRTTVQQFFQALAARDLGGIGGLLAEEVDWEVPGNQELAPWLGKRRTRQDVLASLDLLWQRAQPVRGEMEHLLVEGDFAVVTGEFASRMLPTGKLYESLFSAHFTVVDGLIVRYRLQEDSYGLVVALS